MSVRKRTWTVRGEQREAWVADYVDQGGQRHIKTFAKRRDAESFHANANVEIARGIHTADRRSPTLAEASELWLKSGEAAGLERSTLASYREHVRLHINPMLGTVRLSQLTAPMVRAFEDRLGATRSQAMVHRVLVSLGSIVADAMEHGLIAQNVVRGRRRRARPGERRRKLQVGVDIPTPAEIRTLIPHLRGRWRPLFLVAAFTGLRSSELRGLRWSDINLKRAELHVRQRVDRYNVFGPPKSAAGSRTIPLPPMVVNALREHKLATRSAADLVFASTTGHVLGHSNLMEFMWKPLQVAAGVVTTTGTAKYTGLHALRHFYASWCINRRIDGGLELPPKTVQARMGHASIVITMDVYGHLFPRGDDSAELAAAEKAFLGA